MPENVVYIPPDHWKSMDYGFTEEKKMEKKTKKWPAVLVSAVVALGLGTGIVAMKPDKTLHLTQPVYADNIWNKFGDNITAEDYDDIAEFDMMIFGHEHLLMDKSIGLVDSIRVRNPDFVFLVYTFVFGCRESWQDGPPGSFYRDFWDLIDKNDWWMKDWKGDVVTGPCTTQQPGCSVRFFNNGSPGLATAIAEFQAKYWRKQGLVAHHTGVFLDWITIPYPQWPMPTPRDSLDFNRNGIPQCDDPKDAEFQAQYAQQCADAFRKVFSDEPTFLVVPNGNVHYAKNNKYTHLWDGGMHELVNLYWPKGVEQWKKAMVQSKDFDTSRIDPPLLMFQGGENDSIGFPSEVQASIANGACNFQFRNLPRKLNLGKRVSDPVWSADTVSAVFSAEDGGQYIARAVATDFIWPYLITSFDGADTLSRGGGWPAAEPATELYLILDDYNNWLYAHYGQVIDLVTLQKWASTTADIIGACE